MSNHTVRSLSSYAETHGTTTNPRASIDTTRLAPGTISDRLHDYETRFPDETWVSITQALTGHEPIDDVLTDCKQALENPAEDLTETQQSLLTDDIELLETLQDRVVATVDLRKFDTDGKPPAEANADAHDADNPYSLLTYNDQIQATATGRVFDAVGTTSKQALAINIDHHTSVGPLEVKYGRYHGGFDLHSIDDFESFFDATLQDNGWRRPQDLTTESESPAR